MAWNLHVIFGLKKEIVSSAHRFLSNPQFFCSERSFVVATNLPYRNSNVSSSDFYAHGCSIRIQIQFASLLVEDSNNT